MMIESCCHQCGWVGLDGAFQFCDWRLHWFGFLIWLTLFLDPFGNGCVDSLAFFCPWLLRVLC